MHEVIFSTTCILFSFHDLSTALNRKQGLVDLKSVRGRCKKNNYCKYNSKNHDKLGSLMILWFQQMMFCLVKSFVRRNMLPHSLWKCLSLYQSSFFLSWGFFVWFCFFKDFVNFTHRLTSQRQMSLYEKTKLAQAMGILSLNLMLASAAGQFRSHRVHKSLQTDMMDIEDLV